MYLNRYQHLFSLFCQKALKFGILQCKVKSGNTGLKEQFCLDCFKKYLLILRQKFDTQVAKRLLYLACFVCFM